MPDYDCENHVSEKLDYTPVLSKHFTSFSGVCRRYEFREAFWRVLLFSALYGVVYVIFAFVVLPALLMPLSLGISVEVGIIWVTLIFFSLFWLKNVGIPWFRVYSKRLHAFGKSATYWLLIPNAVIDLIQIILEIGGAGLPLIVGLIHLGYAIYLFCLCFFARAEIDAPVVANPAREALLERLKKKNADARTRKTIKSVQSAVPIVSTVRGEPVDTSAAPPKRSFLFIVVIILVLYGSAYSVYHYIQSQSEDRISEDFAQAELIREAKEKAEAEARQRARDEELARKAEADRKAKEQAAQAAAKLGAKLIHAATNNNVEIVKHLLAAGADVNATDEDGNTPLYEAADQGHTEVVKLLLADPRVRVNKANGYGWTPLYRATYKGHTEVVKLLLASPYIDVNKANNRGETPLYNATSEEHIEIVKLLLASPYIDVNKANNRGRTPLSIAASVNSTKIVKLLLAAPAIDVNKADDDGNTPLMRAAYGHIESVKLLLAAPGISVNKADDDGNTPLKGAASSGHIEVVRLLMAAPGIGVYFANNKLETPLYWAAFNGHTEIVRLLLAAPDISVNQADDRGNTPLMRAASSGHIEIVKLLLDVPGVDVNKADVDGDTPLYRAEMNRHTEIVKLLKAAGARK